MSGHPHHHHRPPHRDHPLAWRLRSFGGPFGPGGPFGDSLGPPFPGRGPRRGRGARGRGRRGDVRAAILALLAEAESPMHGYEMISEIAERTGGFWKPSPGSVYPTLQLLTDEGLIANVGGEGGKRLFELTEEGKQAAENLGEPPWKQIADDVEPNEVALRQAVAALRGALFQITTVGTPEQQSKAVTMINKLRSELYNMLAEVDDDVSTEDE